MNAGAWTDATATATTHRPLSARGGGTAGATGAATVSVGMVVASGAIAMTFAGLLLAYAIVRVQAVAWPPPGEPPPPGAWPWPVAATLAALAGSAAVIVARKAAARAEARGLARALAAAATAGTAFVAIQITAWVRLGAAGVRPSSGIVASVVYTLTMFHALHALAALIALAPALVRAWRGLPTRPTALGAVASFWHLVTAIWLAVFVAVFVA